MIWQDNTDFNICESRVVFVFVGILIFDLGSPPAGYILELQRFSLCRKCVYYLTVDGNSKKQINF